VKIMPRDVSMRWNLTYDMLVFAVKYQPVLKSLTSELNNNLCEFELSDEEWVIATQLRDTLKVSDSHALSSVRSQISALGFEGCDAQFLKGFSQPCLCHPIHGPARRILHYHHSDNDWQQSQKSCNPCSSPSSQGNAQPILFTHRYI
jgi:hypothetical protein